MADLGRQVKYGIGKETTAGTPVAPTVALNQLAFELKPKAEYKDNESSFGVLEKTSGAAVTKRWAEGSLEGKLTTGNGSYIFLGAMGSVVTSDDPDSNAAVKDQTFTINQDINGQSMTLVRKDSLSTEAYALARFNQWEMKMALDDYVTFTADVMSKIGASTTWTPAYTDENSVEFVAKHFSVKTASALGGISGASAITTVQSFTLTVNPNLEADYQSGQLDPYGFSSRGYEISYEMEKRYVDRTYENAYKNGTLLALQATLLNTDTVIGAAANPKIIFTAPRITVDDWDRSEDIDGPVTETVKGKIHFSPTDGYALQSVWTNLTSSY